MTAAALRDPTFPLAAVWHGVARWRQRRALARRLRAEQRMLMALGQHELNDLGIGRSEIERSLRAPAHGAR